MNLHQTLIDTNTKLHFASAGAGADFLKRLWQTPGSSHYLAEASMLQATQALDQFIGFEMDEGYCSQAAAIDMAIAGFIRINRIAKHQNPFSIALTASVATNRIPKGIQRAHFALINNRGVFHQEIPLEKSEGTEARLTHDKKISIALEQLLKNVLEESIKPNADLHALERIAIHPLFLPNGSRKTDPLKSGLYFPANFNPIHQGHRLAYQEAERVSGQEASFMLEVKPPHKKPIYVSELLKRISQVRQTLPSKEERPILITQGIPNYLDKARQYPGSHFIAGADAITRILQANWGYDVNEMLNELKQLDTQFFVLSRHDDGTLVTLDDINIPQAFRHLFHPLEGHENISSSAMRTPQT